MLEPHAREPVEQKSPRRLHALRIGRIGADARQAQDRLEALDDSIVLTPKMAQNGIGHDNPPRRLKQTK